MHEINKVLAKSKIIIFLGIHILFIFILLWIFYSILIANIYLQVIFQKLFHITVFLIQKLWKTCGSNRDGRDTIKY